MCIRDRALATRLNMDKAIVLQPLTPEQIDAYLARRGPRLAGLRASLAAGKGFTPFGTDDPMMRPFVKYPVNHHHAQIIERVQVLGALSAGTPDRGVALEHAFFNGDEPVGPFVGPQWDRVGDSRTTRLTLMPWRGVELQGSRAFVRSPPIASNAPRRKTTWGWSGRSRSQASSSSLANARSSLAMAPLLKQDETSCEDAPDSPRTWNWVDAWSASSPAWICPNVRSLATTPRAAPSFSASCSAASHGRSSRSWR